MGKKLETPLQRDIRHALEEYIGGKFWKVHGGPYQEAGIGDLMGCAFGVYINIEVKTDDDTRGASELQLENIKRVKEEGGCAFVTVSPQAAVRRVRKFLLTEFPFTTKRRKQIYEALENRALQVSARCGEKRTRARRVRLVVRAGDGQDSNSVKMHRRALATQTGPLGFNRVPKKRRRRLESSDT